MCKPEADLAVFNTVNAALRDTASPDELVAWLSGRTVISHGRADLCVFTFFVEVPIEDQVAFLKSHNVGLLQANQIADKFVRSQIAGRTISLDSVC